LQKILSAAGVVSRRAAEGLIVQGRVAVNGTPVLDLGSKADPRTDTISVDGRKIKTAVPLRYVLVNKPTGMVTTRSDPERRRTVLEMIPPDLGYLYPVGRLDYDSEGLLLLTNDGELARRLELPSTGWVRRYRVRVHGEVDQTQLAQLAKGITVEGVRYGGIEATFDRKQGDNVWLTMALTEGKNREIRNICGHFGWPVSRLIRVAYGPFQLGSHLQPGDIEEVPAKVLREQLGEKKVHQVSGQLKLKNAPSPERAHADKKRGEKPRGDKPERRHKPRPKPGRDAH